MSGIPLSFETGSSTFSQLTRSQQQLVCTDMAALLESTTLPVTALYAGILAILFAYLALRVGLTRASNGVMHGDGGKQDMVRKARVCVFLHFSCSIPP